MESKELKNEIVDNKEDVESTKQTKDSDFKSLVTKIDNRVKTKVIFCLSLGCN